MLIGEAMLQLQSTMTDQSELRLLHRSESKRYFYYYYYYYYYFQYFCVF